jgi:hypothetical protein
MFSGNPHLRYSSVVFKRRGIDKVHPLYEPCYVMPRVGNLADQKSSVSNLTNEKFRVSTPHAYEC